MFLCRYGYYSHKDLCFFCITLSLFVFFKWVFAMIKYLCGISGWEQWNLHSSLTGFTVVVWSLATWFIAVYLSCVQAYFFPCWTLQNVTRPPQSTQTPLRWTLISSQIPQTWSCPACPGVSCSTHASTGSPRRSWSRSRWSRRPRRFLFPMSRRSVESNFLLPKLQLRSVHSSLKKHCCKN